MTDYVPGSYRDNKQGDNKDNIPGAQSERRGYIEIRIYLMIFHSGSQNR